MFKGISFTFLYPNEYIVSMHVQFTCDLAMETVEADWNVTNTHYIISMRGCHWKLVEGKVYYTVSLKQSYYCQ